VDVFFYNENIHLLSQAGELLLTLHAGIAQAESENKSENIKWGLRRSTMDPDSPAFSRRCYGYDRNEFPHQRERRNGRLKPLRTSSPMRSIPAPPSMEKPSRQIFPQPRERFVTRSRSIGHATITSPSSMNDSSNACRS
jgi:hypothetical protein